MTAAWRRFGCRFGSAGGAISVILTAGVAAVSIAILAAALCSQSWAQDQPVQGRAASDTKERALRDVRVLIRMGSYGPAVEQLERLNGSYPNDPAIVGALSQALVETKRYDRAEAVLKQFLSARPNDPKGMTDLASLYFTAGKKDDGRKVLEDLVGAEPKEPWPYQLAYQTLWRAGSPDDAIAMIARGRKAVGDSALFAGDAAQILRSAGSYGAATREFVLAGSEQKDPESAVDGVVQMADSAGARPGIIAALDQASADPSLEQVARTCLWQVRLINGECGLAFEQLAALGRKSMLSPAILALFAARSKAKACYGECSKAYDLALTLPENKGQYPLLLLNKGGCEVAGGLTAEAALTYSDVIARYPGTKWACDAGLALGRIYRGQGKFADAIAEADKVAGSGAALEDRFDAILLRGDCLVAMDSLEAAVSTYDLVGTDWEPEYAQEAFYNLGEIKFYQGEFGEATSYYNVTLREYPGEPRANDAIGRLLMMKGIKGDLGTSWLASLAKATLLERQGKTDEAVAIYKELASDPGQGAIKTESLRALSTIYAERGDFDRAVRLCRLVGDSMATYLSPTALETVGDLYLSQGKKPEAVQAYESVILKFPESVSAGEARRKIDVAKRQGE